MRVSDDTAQFDVAMEMTNPMFGKIAGRSGETWEQPAAQNAGGGN